MTLLEVIDCLLLVAKMAQDDQEQGRPRIVSPTLQYRSSSIAQHKDCREPSQWHKVRSQSIVACSLGVDGFSRKGQEAKTYQPL